MNKRQAKKRYKQLYGHNPRKVDGFDRFLVALDELREAATQVNEALNGIVNAMAPDSKVVVARALSEKRRKYARVSGMWSHKGRNF